jgi:hypothetical protein
MTKKKIGVAAFFAALVFITGLFILAGCGDVEETANLTSVGIFPTVATVEATKSQTFTSYGQYSNGTSKAVIATWSVSGSIGRLTTSGYSCIFTASTEGGGILTATVSGKSGTAEITVTASSSATSLATVEVSPKYSTKRVSESISFTAVGKNSSGETVTITSPSWTISSTAVGSFTASGTTATLECTGEGLAYINCLSGTVTGTAVVTVEGYIVEITAEADTYVDETNPTTTYEGSVSVRAGYISATAKHQECYFRFPLTLIPAGASIESAALKVYPTSTTSATLQVRQLNSAFTETTTWNTKPTTGTFLISGAFAAGNYNQLGNETIQTLVQQWKNGTTTNYGLAIIQDGTLDGTVVFLARENGSNQPKLRVEYVK